jgi:hypothetical protein
MLIDGNTNSVLFLFSLKSFSIWGVGVEANFRNTPTPSLLRRMAENIEDTSSLRAIGATSATENEQSTPAGPELHDYDSFLRRMNKVETNSPVSLTQEFTGKGSITEIDTPPDKDKVGESAYRAFKTKVKSKGQWSITEIDTPPDSAQISEESAFHIFKENMKGKKKGSIMEMDTPLDRDDLQETVKLNCKEVFDTGGSIHLAAEGSPVSCDEETNITTAVGSSLLKGRLLTLGHTGVNAVNCPRLREKVLVRTAKYLDDNDFHASITGKGGSILNNDGTEVHRLKVINGIYYMNPSLYEQCNQHLSAFTEQSFLQFTTTHSEAALAWLDSHCK